MWMLQATIENEIELSPESWFSHSPIFPDNEISSATCCSPSPTPIFSLQET